MTKTDIDLKLMSKEDVIKELYILYSNRALFTREIRFAIERAIYFLESTNTNEKPN